MAEYSEIVNRAEWDGATLSASIPPEWAQGKTIFGGLTVGLSLNAMQRHTDQSDHLRSAQTAFIAPVRAGDVAVSTNILRVGRSVTHVEATVRQHGAVCCRVLACYGNDRESSVEVAALAAPSLPLPDELQTIPYMPGISPDFARYVDYRWTPESVPFLGRGKGTASGYIRLRESSVMSPDLFALLVDAWPSPALSMQKGPSPVSSLTWDMELMHPHGDYRSDDWWTIHAAIDATVNGYVHETAHMWAADGVLVARAMQTVSVYQRGERFMTR